MAKPITLDPQLEKRQNFIHQLLHFFQKSNHNEKLPFDRADLLEAWQRNQSKFPETYSQSDVLTLIDQYFYEITQGAIQKVAMEKGFYPSEPILL